MDLEDTVQNNEAHSKAIKIVLLGALSFLLTGAFTGIPAVLMGHRELLRYKKSKKNLDADRRIIIGGVILGYIGIILTLFLILLGFAAYLGWELREFINVST